MLDALVRFDSCPFARLETVHSMVHVSAGGLPFLDLRVLPTAVESLAG